MTTTTITVRYFAAARAAAGVEVDKVQVASSSTVAPGGTCTVSVSTPAAARAAAK